MEGNLATAIMLLFIGMGTVFVVLIIIIEGGKLLIKAVNKFAPEEEPKKQPAAAAPAAISPAVTKVIMEAVSQVTGGQAEVIDIKKA